MTHWDFKIRGAQVEVRRGDDVAQKRFHSPDDARRVYSVLTQVVINTEPTAARTLALAEALASTAYP